MIHPPNPPYNWQPSKCSIYEFVSVWFVSIAFLDSTYKWNHMVFLSFSVWPISLSIMPSRSVHVVVNGKISSFFTVEKYSIVYTYQVIKSYKDVKYWIENIVNYVVITVYGIRWAWELSGWSLHKLHRCLTTVLCDWNYYCISTAYLKK